MCKCKFPDGIIIKPDGIHELDPCVYEDIEIHTSCMVAVSRCKNCGHIEISWTKNDDCDSFDPRTNEPLYGNYEDRNREVIQ